MTCATFLKRGGLLIGWIQVLVSAPSVTPANFMKEASYCATVHSTQILILIWSDFYMNENQAWQVLNFFFFFSGFVNLGLFWNMQDPLRI